MLRMENETLEAESVILEIRKMLEGDDSARVRPSEIAILFRTNEQPRLFELELRRAGIPYVLVGGLSFYDRKEVRDLLGYLRVLANPADEVSLLRVLNTPPRGIGASTVETLLKVAVTEGVPLWTALPKAVHDPDVSELSRSRVDGFCGLITRYRARLGQGTLADLTRDLLGEVNYRAELDRVYKTSSDIEARLASIQEFMDSIALYEQRAENPSLLGFLEETALAGREDQKDDDDKRERHALTLMTLHSAKGLEFPHVYMVGMEEGLLPHQRSIVDGRSIEEERRLCYVGVTRAQDSLTLTFCKERTKWGKARAQIPSRFLMEMRGETERAKRAALAAEALFRNGAEPAESTEGEAANESAGEAVAPTVGRSSTAKKAATPQKPSKRGGKPAKAAAKRRPGS
jgi:DNA helicase-2/ATP-dependent DNA helicase PcrA